jgi:hypothetical protein
MLPVFCETRVWTFRHSSSLNPPPEVSEAAAVADCVDPWLSWPSLAVGSALSLASSVAEAEADTEADWVAVEEGLELAGGEAAFDEQAAVAPPASRASRIIEVAVRPVRVMRLAYHAPPTPVRCTRLGL